MLSKINIQNSQAKKLQELVNQQTPEKSPFTKFITITSGKGGVGKSTISANLAFMLSEMGFKVGLFDADIGLANLDVLLNVKSQKNILHVLRGEAKLRDTVVKINDNLTLIPGESGNEILKYSTEEVLDSLIAESQDIDNFDFVIIDTGAGIGDTVQKFVNASDMTVVITTPDPTAITDAYAMIKVISATKEKVMLVFNQVNSEKEAQLNFDKIHKVASNKLRQEFSIDMIGHLTKNADIQKSVKGRFLFAKIYPTSKSTDELDSIAKTLAKKMERKVLDKTRESGLSGFFKRLIKQF